MRSQKIHSAPTRSALCARLLMAAAMLASAGAIGQQAVNLTAGPATAVMPDGANVPMWGYSCGAAVSGSTATCSALNKSVQAAAVAAAANNLPPPTQWSPVLITVPTGQSLQINLTNALAFTPTGATAANDIPTSIVIVGQLGGGLGNSATYTASPPHPLQGVTWSTLGPAGVAGSPGTFTPPAQGPRVQSFATEVVPTGVTPAANQCASPCTTLVWNNLNPGTYLIESGTHPSIQGPMGLYGVLVVTAAPTSASGVETAAGTAYPGVSYDAEVPLEFSEIDPAQNAAVSAAVNTAGFSETAVWSGQPGHCGNPSSSNYHTCYPPAVNYTPLYFLINGTAFDRTNAAASLFPTAPAQLLAPGAGAPPRILVRMVNAGLHMHTPSIVGAQTENSPLAGGTAATVGGFSLIAEDGNPLPGLPRIQSEVFMAAGKTYDVMINAPAATTANSPPPSLAVYDRALGLSGDATERDAGMLAYIGANGASTPAANSLGAAVARADSYSAVIANGNGVVVPVSVTDPSKGVIANDTNVYGVSLIQAPANGTVTLNSNGTFVYTPNSASVTSDQFQYIVNGGTTCNTSTTAPNCAVVTLGAGAVEAQTGITMQNSAYTATTAQQISVASPGVLSGDVDKAGYPLSVSTTNVSTLTGTGGTGTLVLDTDGGFTATVPGPGTYTFTYKAQNSQGTLSASAATVTLTFPTGSGLKVAVVDGQDGKTPITDYRWIIEEDRTFYVDPTNTTNTATTPGTTNVPTFGVNFHTSNMPVVAEGCTGTLSCENGQTLQGTPAVCDVGDGACRTSAAQRTPLDPSQVVLDPTKRYYISILPGDAGNPFSAGYAGSPCAASTNGPNSGATCVGHGMGGAPIAAPCPIPPGGTATSCATPFAPVTVLSQPSPYQPGKLSVFVFEDDFPLNGENDAGGGVDVLAPNEPGLGGFNVQLWDAMAGNGDFTGQMTYDMFNQPLSNSLAGTIDPVTGEDACPLSKQDTSQPGITGMIVTCPKYEADGKHLSPLAGQAIVANLMPGRFGVIATPGADRIARGEEWHQTNTLDGQKAHDSFIRIGEPSYFQEFGPASYHVTIGFANPAIINGRLKGVCNGSDINITLPPGTACTNTIVGRVTTERYSRTPDERLYSSASHDSFYWTQCYVSVGDPDGEDFAFAKCDEHGQFRLSGLPDGDWRVTVFDQWNDMLVDGLSTPVLLKNGNDIQCPGNKADNVTDPNTCDMGDIATNQWQANIYTRTFLDKSESGIANSADDGVALVPTAVRYRDGSLANGLSTDFTGTANFNETFPLFNWYVVEADTTRYKNTGTHVVYDSGGPADGTLSTCEEGNLPNGTMNYPDGTGYPPCGTSTIGKYLANTIETVSLPEALRVPGSIYCKDADCTGKSMNPTITGNGTTNASDAPSACTLTAGAWSCSNTLSTGRIDNPWLGGTEGWQGFSDENNFVEFGKAPYSPGENGGIKGHVVYASTRPFDDPTLLVQTQWEPLVPHVQINLYQEGTGSDGRPTLTLVDHTLTSSWDDWAQGFHLAADGVTKIPNMNCPGQSGPAQGAYDLFYFTLADQPSYLDVYQAEHGGAPATALPDHAQFKCYDGMHDWNQLQPAPYDGMYRFPSITSLDPVTGKPNGTNCSICVADPATDMYHGVPMLPPGKYVVEVVVPPGFELVKEEDKNILIGDDFIAPATQEFGGLGDVFILPDQASISAEYNANSAVNPTQNLESYQGPSNGIVPGFIPEPVWPCVGEKRVVPDYISLAPGTHQISPFAGATRPLCDRKEVTLGDQMGANAKFYVFTPTHIASKFTGIITDDFTSEFDPFAPTFGEKFSPPDMPVSFRDWTGTEISRVYSDHWGAFNGMTYSSWEVNPPNPTGYAPTMMVTCMNDPGPIPDPSGAIDPATGKVRMITDPLFNPAYSQFCYELPFMPGQTQYMDTPVVPTSAFAGAGYNNVDCAYPDETPAIKEVDGDTIGPWVKKAGHALTITALGDAAAPNYAYSGPSATVAPWNAKTTTRHYGFGNTAGKVTIGGRTATVQSWSDTQIVVTAPEEVPACAVQQQAQYGGSEAHCGELVITAANGKRSIDTVTVTIGGKTPTVITASDPMTPYGPGAIQRAIDAALPGDLIIVPPGTYNEMLLMWKPVRLQGVGAASSVINANTQPAGKLDPWRHQVNCLFGLALNGTPLSKGNPYDSDHSGLTCPGKGWNAFAGQPQQPQIDRLPLEGIVGWDTTTNGNLAQLLQEPTLMGAYEGAAITVLAKGVNTHGAPGYYGSGAEAAFPTGSTVLTGSAADCGKGVPGEGDDYRQNPYPSNFHCNPSAIDGLSITDSSQGGGGIYVHAWGHNLQIANNRIYNNIGTLSGGIDIGQGESPDAYLKGTPTDSDPGSCEDGGPTNTQLPFCFNLHVNIHNNDVTMNTSIGDELFSGTPAGAGGVSVCTGADYYKFNYNWVCGNLSTGDGGGFSHLGFIKNGRIAHNAFLFNQSTNPTIATNGGGVIIEGAAPDGFTAAGIECGGTPADLDCPPGLPDGTGPHLVIDANLILGNGAESGSGGGLRLQSVNGTEVAFFPKNPGRWNSVAVTNNIIANNVAGWDGGGVSLQDALNVRLINNTIESNDTTASSGVLFNTLGAPLASAPGAPAGQQTTSASTSAPQAAGLVSMPHSSNLAATFPRNKSGKILITCPTYTTGSGKYQLNCTSISDPFLENDVLWQNRSYYVGVGAFATDYQQNIVTLFQSFTSTPAPSQPPTDATTANGNGATITGGIGACTPASYWDLGVRGDTGPGKHDSGYSLSPFYSVLTNTGAASEQGGGANDLLGSNPAMVSQYCNGSRTPPEAAANLQGAWKLSAVGWQVPPGIADATVPNPLFSLTPTATVDEGNNWVNMSWGPLTLVNPTVADPTTAAPLGNYQPAAGSPAIGAGSAANAPARDFFGLPRTTAQGTDIGAVQYRPNGNPPMP